MSVSPRRATRAVPRAAPHAGKAASPAFPRAGALLALCAAAAAVSVACKPSKGGSGSPNVFNLEPGEYAYVRGTLRDKPAKGAQGNGAAGAPGASGAAKGNGAPALAKGGSGKIVSVESRGGGRMTLTNTGKYAWRAGEEPEINVDCTTAQDVFAFEVYTVVAGTGRLGNLEAKRGCRLEPEPDARQEWSPVSITPRGQGEFTLVSEATHRGRALVLEETYRAKRAE